MLGDRLYVGLPDGGLVDPVRADGQGDDYHQEEDGDDGDGAAITDGRLGGGPADPVQGHDDDAAGQDGRDVGGEQQERGQGLAGGAGFQGEADDGERRHQGDGDGHAGQGVGNVRPDQGHRAYGSGGQRGYQVGELEGGPGGHLGVGLRDYRVGDEQA